MEGTLRAPYCEGFACVVCGLDEALTVTFAEFHPTARGGGARRRNSGTSIVDAATIASPQ